MAFDDFDKIWLEVAGIAAPVLVADFLLSYLQWFDDGEPGIFQAEAPFGWVFQDLCTVGYLLANKEVSSAQGMVDRLLPQPVVTVPRPMVMLPSSTLMEANDNHLKRNPFKRKSRKRSKPTAKEANAGRREGGGLHERQQRKV